MERPPIGVRPAPLPGPGRGRDRGTGVRSMGRPAVRSSRRPVIQEPGRPRRARARDDDPRGGARRDRGGGGISGRRIRGSGISRRRICGSGISGSRIPGGGMSGSWIPGSGVSGSRMRSGGIGGSWIPGGGMSGSWIPGMRRRRVGRGRIRRDCIRDGIGGRRIPRDGMPDRRRHHLPRTRPSAHRRGPRLVARALLVLRLVVRVDDQIRRQEPQPPRAQVRLPHARRVVLHGRLHVGHGPGHRLRHRGRVGVVGQVGHGAQPVAQRQPRQGALLVLGKLPAQRLGLGEVRRGGAQDLVELADQPRPEGQDCPPIRCRVRAESSAASISPCVGFSALDTAKICSVVSRVRSLGFVWVSFTLIPEFYAPGRPLQGPARALNPRPRPESPSLSALPANRALSVTFPGCPLISSSLRPAADARPRPRPRAALPAWLSDAA